MSKVLLSDSDRQKMIDFLLLNSCSVVSDGLANGKSGLCLVFFELSRTQKIERLEEYAFELLQQVLVHERKNVTFSNGAAGIGYLLFHLIRERFVEGDYNELFGQQHRKIICTIQEKDFESANILEYIYLLLFLYETVEFTPMNEFLVVRGKLVSLIREYFHRLEEMPDFDREMFYPVAGKFFHACFLAPVILKDCKGIIADMISLHRMLEQKDMICDNYEYGYYFSRYSEMTRQPDLMVSGRLLKSRLLVGMFPGVLLFREKIDNMLYCCLDRESMGAVAMDVFEKLMGSIRDSASEALVRKIVSGIPHKAYYVGLEQGVVRLLMLDNYLVHRMRSEHGGNIWWLLI